MKLVIFSAQKNIYKEGSYERKRLEKMAKRVDELHVVLACISYKLKSQKIGDNLYIHPTNSSNYLMLIFDGIHTGDAVIQRLTGDQVLLLGEDTYYVGLITVVCAKRSKKRSVLYVGDNIFSKEYIAESKDHYLRSLLSRFTLKRATSIRVFHESIKYSMSVELGRNIESKIFVLPNYIDLEYIRQTPAKNDLRDVYTNFHFIILVAAPLEKVSNIRMSILALDAITFEQPRTGMIIMGSGPEKKRLQSTVHRLGLDNNVIFEDVKSDIISPLKRADMFLSTQKYTNDNTYLKEAAAAASAIVTTRTGIANDVLKNNESALVCDFGDLACVVHCIQKMMKNPIAREDMGANAQQEVMSVYSMDEDMFTQHFISSLQDVINDKYIRYETFNYRER